MTERDSVPVLDRRPGRPHSPGVGRVGPFPGLLGSVGVSIPADGPDGEPAPDGLRPVDVLTVVTVADVTPSVRRVVLSGSPAAVAAAGPTVSLLVPRVGDAAPRWPRVAKDGRIVWPDGAHGVSLRSYTARRQDPVAGRGGDRLRAARRRPGRRVGGRRGARRAARLGGGRLAG